MAIVATICHTTDGTICNNSDISPQRITSERCQQYHIVSAIQWCRVAIICRTVCFFIPLHFVTTLEAPLDVEQEVVCGSQGEEDGPPRNGNSIDSLGMLMLWGI